MARVRNLAAVTTGLLTALAFAPTGANAGTPEPASSTSVNLPDPSLSHARQLLRSGQTAQAERIVRGALLSDPSDTLLTLSGEIAFRRADFDDAAAAFTSALLRNPDNARAHWGLGRIDQLHFRAEPARNHFSRAYSFDPRDTDIILSYAEFVDDPGSRATLLRNVAVLSWPADPDRAERAVAQLKILERLQGRTPARLASPYTSYRLPLSGFRPVGAKQEGVILTARINHGKPVRLLLDSGARGLSLSASAAKGLALEPIVASRLGGLGDTGVTSSQLALARTLAIGNLTFDECLIDVSEHSLTNGADGTIGLDLFERFQIHLNASAHSLDLTPFDGHAATTSSAGFSALGLRNLLLLHTRLESGKAGLFLLDTGASFTAVARDLVPAAAMQGQPLDLRGAQGPLSALRLSPLQLSVAGRPMMDAAPLALDLRPFSQIEGVEIAGILGYSLLGKSSLKIDLRNGTVEFVKPR